MPIPFRLTLPVALSMLCCACSTPEERADAAFSELTAAVHLLHAELAGVTSDEAAARALPRLEEQAEELRDILERIDKLALDPDLTPEARLRVSVAHHPELRKETDAVLHELSRLARRSLYYSEGMKRLARREYAHYSTKGVHPWPRAVLFPR